MSKQFQEWTDWIEIDHDEMAEDGWVEEGRYLPVPPWMQVMVKSGAGEYPDIETARFFSWEPIHGPFSLLYYKVRLH